MGKVWFTSDLHFCHQREFLYEPRGFNSVYEMNEAIVKNFNEVVGWDDDLYILGDIMLNDNVEGTKLLQRLPGQNIYIIRGNHDTDTRLEIFKGLPRVTYLGYADIIKFGNQRFYLSHFPTVTTNFDDGHEFRKRVLSLSGHTHSKEIWQPTCPTSYNVALDAHNNYPVEITEIYNTFKEKFV